MKKYQKLYQLKQIVKANQEYFKYYRLTAKAEHSKEYDEKLKANRELYLSLTKNFKMSLDSRLLHITYSLLKGKSYEQIENSVREQNQLKDYEWKQIVDMMNEYKDEENTCIIPTSPFPTTKINVSKIKKVEETNE